MGYSSSGIGPGFIKVSYGLGGGGGPRLTRDALKGYEYGARRYLEETGKGVLPIESISLSRNLDDGFPIHPLDPSVLAPHLERISYDAIFSGMEVLEKRMGEPVYIEWAIGTYRGRQQTFLTQLAKVPRETEIWEFGNVDSVLFHMDDVRRGRNLEIGAMVFVEGRHQLPGLARFNAENSAYLLIYGESLMGSVILGIECPLNTMHVSNAHALALQPYIRTCGDYEEHLRGMAESLGVMIGRGSLQEFGSTVRRHFTIEHGLEIYRRPMRVRYSSSQQAAVVTPA